MTTTEFSARGRWVRRGRAVRAALVGATMLCAGEEAEAVSSDGTSLDHEVGAREEDARTARTRRSKGCAGSRWGRGTSRMKVLERGRFGGQSSGAGRVVEAYHRAMGLHVRFSATGVAVQRGGRPETRLTMGLRWVGCGEETPRDDVLAVEPQTSSDRVTYERVVGGATVQEWYAIAPNGLEQGFTVEELPGCGGAEELVLEIALGGAVEAAVGATETVELRTRVGEVAYYYGALSAVDGSGQRLASRLVGKEKGAALYVDVRGATLPVEIDPLIWTDEWKLVASDGTSRAEFGYAVSLSADGRRALVGAFDEEHMLGPQPSGAYVYVREGMEWREEQKLVVGDPGDLDEFGYAVSLSADGTRALVGPHHGGTGAGASTVGAHVFVREGTAWREEQMLVPSDGNAAARFGQAVSLNADGSRALVAARGYEFGTGIVYVFVRDGMAWTEEAKLLASDGKVWDFFGWSVSLSADGSRALVGAVPDDVGGGPAPGSAYVFVRDGTEWREEAKLLASDGAAWDKFGYAVALSADGRRALVGAARDDVGAHTNQGSAYVFVRDGTEWREEAKLLASDGRPVDVFGYAVALDADGSRALVGAYWDDVGMNQDQGSAYLFLRNGSTWVEAAKLVASDGVALDLLGAAVSLSADGSYALVGARLDDVGEHENQGSAYVFRLGSSDEGGTGGTGGTAGAGDTDGTETGASSGGTGTAGSASSEGGGCACGLARASGSPDPGPWPLLALLGVVLGRRRRGGRKGPRRGGPVP